MGIADERQTLDLTIPTEVIHATAPRSHRRTPRAPRPLAASVGWLAAIALLTPLHGIWAVQLLLVPALLVVPGVIALRALRVPGAAVAACPVYVPAASLVVLMFSGLVIDLIGPLAGIAAPLRTVPLLITFLLACGALLACSRSAPPETEIGWTAVLTSVPAPVRLGWPLLFPLASAAGALRLNSGHSGALAVVTVCAVMAAIVAAFLAARRFDDKLFIVFIFALGLAMMWSYSLRGDLVYGFDISSEYYAMEQAVTSGVWHVSHPNDAYGAMLSLTVLPAELHALSGVPALLILKVIYPVTGALFPVAAYLLARRVLTRRWAFMAAALILMQQAFFQQMPALARQEIATLLFAAVVLVVLDGALPRRTRWAFACLLSLGVVVSHYSTAYLAITLLAIWIGVQWAASWVRKVPRVAGAALLACAITLGGTTLWYGAITHSSSNASGFVTLAENQGINLLPNQGSNLLATYLQGEKEQMLSPAQFESLLVGYFARHDKFIKALPDASEPQYAPQPAPEQEPAYTSQTAENLVTLVDLLIQQSLNLMAGLGALSLALRRKISPTVRQIGLISLAGMLILMLARVSGTIAQEYNPDRAFLQMSIVLTTGVCCILQQTGSRWKATRAPILALVSAAVVAFFIGSSGLTGVILGGGPSTNLADNGNDYQQFTKPAPDVAAADWVTSAAAPGQIIYADNYTELILNTAAANRPGIFDAILPETIDQHGWVYATDSNLKDNIVRGLYGQDYSYYTFPSKFLDANFNVVYTNGGSEVFHR